MARRPAAPGRGHSAFPRRSFVLGTGLCQRGNAESPRLGTPRRATGTFSFSAPVVCAGHRLVSARKRRKSPAGDASQGDGDIQLFRANPMCRARACVRAEKQKVPAWDASQGDGDIQLFRANPMCRARACVRAEKQKVPVSGRLAGRRGHSAFPRRSFVQGTGLCQRGNAESPRLGRLAERRGHSAFPRQSDVQGSSLCARGKPESPRTRPRLVSARKTRKPPSRDASQGDGDNQLFRANPMCWDQACVSAENQKVPVRGPGLCARGNAESPRLGTPRRATGTFSFSAPVRCAGTKTECARKSRKSPSYDGSFRTAPALALVTIRQ